MEPSATRSACRVSGRRCLQVLAMRLRGKQFNRIAAICYKGQHIIGEAMRKLIGLCSGWVYVTRCGL